MSQKQVIVHFPNRGIYDNNHQKLTVGMIPWNKVSIIQHSFFSISDDWTLISTDYWADFQKPFDHSEPGDNELKGHIGEYKYYKNLYPNKKVLISIGDEESNHKFSKIASNNQKRKIFITSCLEFLKKYSFIDGLNIHWKYPEKKDKFNFTILLKEIRDSFNINNIPEKWLTITAPANYENILNQDIANYQIYIDLANIMSIDYYGSWDKNTNHHSPLYYNSLNTDINSQYFNVDFSVKQFLEAGLPKEKLCIASPLYSRGWGKLNLDTKNIHGLFANATDVITGSWDEPGSTGGIYPWFELKKFELHDNWEKFYDDFSKVPYLFNITEKLFLTYEDETSIKEKCNYILSNDLAGLSLVGISGDNLSNEAPMTSIAWNILSGNQEYDYLDTAPPRAATVSINDPISIDGNYELTLTICEKNSAKEYEIFENDILIKSDTLQHNSSEIQTILYNVTDKSPGIYVYKIILKNENFSVSSPITIVNVETTTPPTTKPSPPIISVDTPRNTGTYTVSILNPPDNTATHLRLYENNINIGETIVDPSLSQETYQTIFEDKPSGSYVYKAELFNENGASESHLVTVTVTSIIPSTSPNLPTIPLLIHTNWNLENNYTIISNMWYGSNATKLSLYENNILVTTRELKDNTPNTQTQKWNFNNKPNGTYYYHIIAENIHGKVKSKVITVNVCKGVSGNIPNLILPTLSVDSLSNKGNYTLTINLPDNNSATEFKLYENNLVISSGLLTPNKDIEETLNISFVNKLTGKYDYKLILSNNHLIASPDLLTVTVNNQSTSSNDQCPATMLFKVLSDWGINANFEITLFNNHTVSIDTWTLEFDFDKPITMVWNAQMDIKENHYAICNLSSGGTIQPSGSFTFIGTCEGNIGTISPRNTMLNGKILPMQ